MRPQIPVSSALDEESARADIYGLLANLYYAKPPHSLLDAIRTAATEAPAAGAYLEEPWRDLVGTARAMTDHDIGAEFDALFGGVGKPEVYLYGSHYLSGFLNEKPLARLRTDLERLGLCREEAMSETEDHIAYLCEVMRFLIAGEDVKIANLGTQREFFAAHLQPWLARMCDAIAAHPRARFYSRIGNFTKAFASVEAQGFDLLA
jgi:TorA maturation chaperone TorD